jgi:hypothetical protein
MNPKDSNRLRDKIIEIIESKCYADICELAGQLALPIERQSIFDAVGRENYDRFKNHIGW